MPRLTLLLVVLGALAGSGLAPLPVPAAAGGSLDDLQSQLQELVRASGLDIAVAVTDLQTGETAGVGIDQPRFTGCTINLLVLIQALLDVQDGSLAFEDVDWMIADIVYYSDARLARDLLLMLGPDLPSAVQRVQGLAAGLGLASAVFDHPPGFEDESLSLLDNSMTPADINRLLAMLWRGEILQPRWTEYLLARMTDVHPSLQYVVAAVAGDGTTAMHKNGFYITDDGLAYVDNDVGIVTVQTDAGVLSYAFSFFSIVPAEYGEESVGTGLSWLVWRWFLKHYGAHVDGQVLASAAE